jgi:predicted secreted protein
MNREKLAKANTIVHSIDALWALNSVMAAPYPQFDGADRREVNSARFDTETLVRLKKVVTDFIETRINELEKEFEQL